MGERILIPRHWFEAAVKEAKRPKFTWRCLRHTFAGRLVMMGDDLRTVQELMGDKDIRITCRDAHRAPGAQARGGGEARGVELRKS
jgi:site-specific recombinase XerC